MKEFGRKYAAESFLLFLIVLIFASCENFMDGKELKEDLNRKISYENSEPQNIYFNSSCGKISPNGMEKFRVTDKINLMFTEDQDYQFIQWQILDQNDNDITNAGYLSIADKFNANTEAVFNKNPKNGLQMKVVPVCAAHPKVISWTPALDSSGAYRDARIAVAFDHELNEESIYFTENEIEDLKSNGISEFLSVENSETRIVKTYGYKKDDEIFYKNVTIADKETGENLLSKYGVPEFDGGDTFVLPVKNDDPPLAGTQIIVELKNFFYEYEDDSVIEENKIIKMGSSHKWHYFVNGKTDSIPPTLPEGYFIETSGINLDGENRTFSKTVLNESDKNFLKEIYLKDKKLHIKASIFDEGSGIASDGFWAEIKKVYDEYYIAVNEDSKKVPLPVKAFSSIANCDTYIDFAAEKFADGIYHIDFYAKDKNGNGSTTVLKDGGYVLLDGTAPKAVEGLRATYSSSKQTLSVYCGLPNIDGKTVNDFSHIIFNAKKVASDETETVIESNKIIKPSDSETVMNYTLNGIESTEDGTRYIFSVKTVDIFGNTLNKNEEIVEQTPETATYLTEILLNEYHFSGYSYDNIIATAYFSDMEIDETSEVKMQLYQNDSPYENPKPATVNSETGLASAKFSIPYRTSDEGVIFTVKLLINDDAVKNKNKEEVSARFNVSGRSKITDAVLSTELISLTEVKQNKTELTATVTGYNMDLEDKLRMQIINSKNEIVSTKEISTEELKWTAKKGTNKAKLTISDSIPETDDIYTVKITSGTSSITKTLHVYDVPKFTAFIIPNASVLKSRNKVIASVYGKNFQTPDFNSENLKISGGTIPELLDYEPTVTVKDDSFMTITLPVSRISGRHYVNLQMGENSIVGTFNVIAENTIDYSVGDLILSDGSRIPYSSDRTAFTEEDFKDAAGNDLVPVAVYFGTNENGAPIGVGITNSYAEKTTPTFTWAPYKTTGFSKMFSEIVGEETTGDMDGSDNWSVICALDPEGTKEPAKNYPAFNYANTYGTRLNLSEKYKDGWYLPSCGELYELSKNRIIINNVIGMIPEKYEHSILYSYEYWSSTQAFLEYPGVNPSLIGCSIDFYTAVGIYRDKDSLYYVCAIRAF